MDADLRARHAAAMVDNPLFNEAIDQLETNAVKAWLDCKDPVERERLWMWANQARNLRRHFETIVSNARFDAQRGERSNLP